MKGYYVTNQNDSVVTYINNKDWDTNPNIIQVKSNIADKEFRTFTPITIKSFGFTGGEQYVSAIVNIDKSPTQLNYMAVGSKPVVITDTLFLRVLVSGPVNLFYYKDENAKEHFYFQEKAAQPQELILRKYLVEANGNKSIATSEIYKGQLNNLFASCPEVKAKINRIDFKPASLINIIQQYNNCQGATTTDKVTEKKPSSSKFGLIAGATQSNIKLSNRTDLFEDLAGIDFKSSTSYAVGLTYTFVFPRNRQQWSIYNELVYKPYSLRGSYQEVTTANYYTNFNYKLGFGYVGLGNMLRYQFPLQKIKPFVNVGLANNLVIHAENELETQRTLNGVTTVKQQSALKSYRKHEQALLAGVGLATTKVSAEIRIESGTGFSDYRDLKTSKNMISFLVGFLFN